MAEFNVRADEVNVEQIMHQIRARIREKRGVDYTEEQIQELAKIKLEKFLDPRGVRSDLLEQFQRAAATDLPPTYEFDDQTLIRSGNPLVAFIRRLLPARAEAVLQPEPARAGAALPDADQPLPPRARGARRPGLRGDAQPRGRDDAHRHRGEEHEDARRVDRQAGSTSTSGAPARSRRSCSTSPGPRGRSQQGRQAPRGEGRAAAPRRSAAPPQGTSGRAFGAEGQGQAASPQGNRRPRLSIQ